MTERFASFAICFIFALLSRLIPATGNYDAATRIESARLYGNINQYAYYFTDLLVGTTPQRVSVIVDTGSSLCGFPCEGCEHCGKHIDPPFAIDRSLSARWILCGSHCQGNCHAGVCSYRQGYTEGSSISGLWFRDLVQLGGGLQENPPVNATLGCHVDERKLFYTQRVNGIMGMAPHENSGRPTILQDLFVDRKHVNTGIFSICLSEWGGELSVGGYKDSVQVNGSSIAWTPLMHSRYYAVTLNSLSLDSAIIAGTFDEFGTSLVDSGTTFTYFPHAVYNRLAAALISACSTSPGCGAIREGGSCWRMTGDSRDPVHFPFLSISLQGGAVVRWPPHAYLFRRQDPMLWCNAFADNGADSDTVLGVSWMLHKDVIFDLRNSRLGVVEADCPQHRKAPGDGEGADKFSGNSGVLRHSVSAIMAGGIATSLLLSAGFFLFCFFGTARGCRRDGSYSPQSDESQ